MLVKVVSARISACIQESVHLRDRVVKHTHVCNQLLHIHIVCHLEEIVAEIIEVLGCLLPVLAHALEDHLVVRPFLLVISIFLLYPDQFKQPVVRIVGELKSTDFHSSFEHPRAYLSEDNPSHHVIPVVIAETGSEKISFHCVFPHLIGYPCPDLLIIPSELGKQLCLIGTVVSAKFGIKVDSHNLH